VSEIDWENKIVASAARALNAQATRDYFAVDPAAPGSDVTGIMAWLPSAEAEPRCPHCLGRLDMFRDECSLCGVTAKDLAEQPVSPRPVCECGQAVWSGGSMCSDCRMGCGVRGDKSLDARICEAQRGQDPTSDWSAWAHPSSEGP
jgi:hypothetical protein